MRGAQLQKFSLGGVLVVLTMSMLAPLPCQAQRVLALTGATIETATDEGTIENGTIVISGGKISAIGTDVEIPVSAKIVDMSGHTIMPGIVDPYFTVSIGRNVAAAATRTVVFRGRTFVIGGGSPAIATTFAKVVDGLDLTSVEWAPPIRSGVTTLHVVTAGYAQSMIAQADGHDSVQVLDDTARILVSVSNETKSLDVLRKGLKPEGASKSTGSRRPTPEQIAAMRARMGGRGNLPVSAPPSSSSSSAKSTDPLTEAWKAIMEGKAPVFVNVNNAASILHIGAAAKDAKSAKIALVSSGQDAFLNLESLDGKRHTLVIRPNIDLKPNSSYRINVPKLLNEKKVPFAFSLSLGQSDFRAQQHTPLFAVGMLVKGGLDRQTALQALTLRPAELLGIEKEVGTLEKGKKANLVVLDGDPFAATSSISQVFVEGKIAHEDEG